MKKNFKLFLFIAAVSLFSSCNKRIDLSGSNWIIINSTRLPELFDLGLSYGSSVSFQDEEIVLAHMLFDDYSNTLKYQQGFNSITIENYPKLKTRYDSKNDVLYLILEDKESKESLKLFLWRTDNRKQVPVNNDSLWIGNWSTIKKDELLRVHSDPGGFLHKSFPMKELTFTFKAMPLRPGNKLYSTPSSFATQYGYWFQNQVNDITILTLTLDIEEKYDLFHVSEIKPDTIRMTALDFYTLPELTLVRNKKKGKN